VSKSAVRSIFAVCVYCCADFVHSQTMKAKWSAKYFQAYQSCMTKEVTQWPIVS